MKLAKTLAVLLVVLMIGCAKGGESPSDADINKALAGLPLEGFVLKQKDMGPAGKDGGCKVAVWGAAKDKGEDMNIFVVFDFVKKDGAWNATIGNDGMFGEPLRERDDTSFYKDTRSAWDQIKGKAGGA